MRGLVDVLALIWVLAMFFVILLAPFSILWVFVLWIIG